MIDKILGGGIDDLTTLSRVNCGCGCGDVPLQGYKEGLSDGVDEEANKPPEE